MVGGRKDQIINNPHKNDEW